MEEQKLEEELAPLVLKDHKSSGENKKVITNSRNESATEEGAEDSSQTVFAALPIHVQLYEGPVIQITSTTLVDSENRGDGELKREVCEEEKGNEGSCMVGGEVSAGGAVTLLTSDGKTYILPQPISPGNGTGGGYLITEEVLSAEEVLQSSNVLKEEQMLTISPPPPSALEFLPSDAQPPDALAIATSEVFSNNYVPLPLESQSQISESRTFQLKAEDRDGISKTHPQCKISHLKEAATFSDLNTITKPSSCPTERGGWLGKGVKECNRKLGLAKIEGEIMDGGPFPTERIEGTDQLDTNAIEGTDCRPGRSMKEIDQTNPAYSSILSKWCGIRNISVSEFTGDFPSDTLMPPKMTLQETMQCESASLEIEGPVNIETSVESLSVGKKPFVGKKCEESQGNASEVPDPTTLRRSTRIRRAKMPPSEAQFTVPEDGERSSKRRRGARGEINPGLWECGSCDAMFRTKAGRERHLEEGHAFTCYVCGWRGSSKTKYEVHISTLHCHQHARCLVCRKDFENYESYRQHMRSTHHSATTTPAVKMEVENDAKLQEGQRVEVVGEERERGEQQQMSGDKEKDPDDPDIKDSKAGLTRVEVRANAEEAGIYHGYRAEQGCPYCSKTFHRRSRFLRHLNYHLGNRSFVCNICNKSFVEKSGLDAHMLTHQPLNAACGECGKVFKTPRTMKRHLRTHLGRSFPCEVCSKAFRHEESLRVHKAVHREGGSGNICELCEKDCKTPYYLQLHLSTKHEAAKFTCVMCQRSFKWKQSYRKHMAIYHGDAQLKYECVLCRRHFLTLSELRLHKAVHSSERKHLCDICGKAFKHEYTRDKHVKTVHRDDREHVCPQCGSLFKAKAYLDQHLAHVHTTRERVKCKHCGHDFKTEANLRSHIKIVHKAKNRKYPCQSCNKTFLAPKDLARHSKVHTGVKDYSCPKCHRCFSRKDNMAAHLRTHTLDQPSLAYDLKSDPANPQPPPQEGVTQILGLPSSLSCDMPPSSNILLPSVHLPTNVIHTVPSSSSHIVISNIAPENISLTDVTINSNSTSLPSVPVSVGGLSSLPSSSNGLILSSVPIASLGVPGISTQSTSTSTPLCYTHPSDNCLSQGGSTLSSGGLISSTSNTSSQNMIVNIGRTTQQHTYNLHSHLATSSLPTTVQPVPSASTSLPSTVLSLPPHPVSSSPILMPQMNRAQIICSTFQPDQVVLAAGVVSVASTTAFHHTHTSPHYSQLDHQGVSISSSGTTSLGSTVPSCATLGPSIPPPPSVTEGSHLGVSERGVPPETSDAGIILPSSSSLLHDTALIIPEKSGVYTLVSEGGKITPLETLRLNPVSACSPADDPCQPIPPICPPPLQPPCHQ